MIRRLLFVILFCGCPALFAQSGQAPLPVRAPGLFDQLGVEPEERPEIKLADAEKLDYLRVGSWDLFSFGTGSRSSPDIARTADVIARFDMLLLNGIGSREAIELVMESLKAGTGIEWRLAIGPIDKDTLGSAFLWRPDRVAEVQFSNGKFAQNVLPVSNGRKILIKRFVFKSRELTLANLGDAPNYFPGDTIDSLMRPLGRRLNQVGVGHVFIAGSFPADPSAKHYQKSASGYLPLPIQGDTLLTNRGGGGGVKQHFWTNSSEQLKLGVYDFCRDLALKTSRCIEISINRPVFALLSGSAP